MKKTLLLFVILIFTITARSQWYYTGVEASVISVTFVSSNTGFASSGWTVMKTTDGGTTWNGVLSASMDSIIMAMSFPSSNVGYVAGLGGNALKTTDGGNTWTRLNCGTNKNFWSVCFTDENTGYIGGEGSLVKTTDGGLTWQTLSSPVGTVYSMCFTSNNFGIIAGNTSGVYRTQDGGANWLEIAFPSPNKFISVHFPDNQTAFACGMKDALTPCMIKSTDGGMKWTEVAVPVGLGLNVVFFRNDHLGYAGGFGGTIIKTTDGGATWVRQTTPDQGLIHSIFFTDDNHGFAGGAALIRTDNGGTANGIFENNVSGQVLIHPNPAREMVTVSIDKPGTGGELTVYNRQGAKILQRQVALFPVEINVSGWADGLYLVRISDDDKLTWTGKLKK